MLIKPVGVDADSDGVDDAIEAAGAVDTDGDGTPDYLDLDSDDDGIPDTAEGNATGGPDTDGDGIPDYLDFRFRQRRYC